MPLMLVACSDIAKRAGGDTPRNYLEATWGVTGPVHCQRPRGFDFRNFCSTMEHKEDENMEKIGGRGLGGGARAGRTAARESVGCLMWLDITGTVCLHNLQARHCNRCCAGAYVVEHR